MHVMATEEKLANLRRQWYNLKKKEARLLVQLKRATDPEVKVALYDMLRALKSEIMRLQKEIARCIRILRTKSTVPGLLA